MKCVAFVKVTEDQRIKWCSEYNEKNEALLEKYPNSGICIYHPINPSHSLFDTIRCSNEPTIILKLKGEAAEDLQNVFCKDHVPEIIKI